MSDQFDNYRLKAETLDWSYMGHSIVAESTRGNYRIHAGRLYFTPPGMAERLISKHVNMGAAKKAAREHYNEEA